MCKNSSVNSPSSNRQYQVLRQFVSAITGSHMKYVSGSRTNVVSENLPTELWNKKVSKN